MRNKAVFTTASIGCGYAGAEIHVRWLLVANFNYGTDGPTDHLTRQSLESKLFKAILLADGVTYSNVKGSIL